MHDTEDPTRSSAADAAGMAADYSARHTYARGYDDGRNAEKARADAAEQRAAELRGLLQIAHQAVVHEAGIDDDAQHLSDRIDAALASTADIAGRWVPKADLDLLHAKMGMVVAERDAAIAARDEAVREVQTERAATAAKMHDVKAFKDMWEKSERARDELGIQYAAAQERLRLAAMTIETMWAAIVARTGANYDAAVTMRAKWDTVPGDALAPSNVKGGE